MAAEPVDLNGFLAALCEAPYRWIQQALDEVDDDKLYFRPEQDSNHIAWLVWHLSRWRDRISAAVLGEPEVWVRGGWHESFDIDPERTGLGDTPEQVAQFRPGPGAAGRVCKRRPRGPDRKDRTGDADPAGS